MKISNIITFQPRNMSRGTYKIMGGWKKFTSIMC